VVATHQAIVGWVVIRKDLSLQHHPTVKELMNHFDLIAAIASQRGLNQSQSHALHDQMVLGIVSQHTAEHHIHTCDYRFFSITHEQRYIVLDPTISNLVSSTSVDYAQAFASTNIQLAAFPSLSDMPPAHIQELDRYHASMIDELEVCIGQHSNQRSFVHRGVETDACIISI
jgi:hypothetical protein